MFLEISHVEVVDLASSDNDPSYVAARIREIRVVGSIEASTWIELPTSAKNTRYKQDYPILNTHSREYHADQQIRLLAASTDFDA
jgi:hypothetical protein